MILVFILLGILILLSIIALVLILSTIKIRIENLEIKNFKLEKSKLNKQKFKILFQIYFLGKIKILSINLNSPKIKKIYSNQNLKNIDFKEISKKIPLNKENIKIIKDLKIKLENFNFSVKIGTEDAILTSYIVAIIASVIGIILPYLVDKNYKKDCKYKINPIYNINILNLHLNSIISAKIVHIICVICNLVKISKLKNKESEKNGRTTSNRRAYAYSHEFN